jgi:hypothetical protein
MRHMRAGRGLFAVKPPHWTKSACLNGLPAAQASPAGCDSDIVRQACEVRARWQKGPVRALSKKMPGAASCGGQNASALDDHHGRCRCHAARWVASAAPDGTRGAQRVFDLAAIERLHHVPVHLHEGAVRKPRQRADLHAAFHHADQFGSGRRTRHVASVAIGQQDSEFARRAKHGVIDRATPVVSGAEQKGKLSQRRLAHMTHHTPGRGGGGARRVGGLSLLSPDRRPGREEMPRSVLVFRIVPISYRVAVS